MELLFNAYKQESLERKPEGEKFKLLISRPREYLVQNAPVPQSEKIEETVKDSPRKMSLIVSPNISSEEIREELEKVHPLKAMQFLTQRGTNDSLGLVFVEFSVDEKDSLEKQVPQLQTYLKQVSHISFVQNAFFSCIIPNQTDIQTCSVEYDTLKPLVRNEFVQSHSKSKVIQLLNCVTLQELNDDTSYKFIQQDIKQEASKFGNVVSIKIPRPEHGGDFFVETRRGLGKVFIEFEDYDVALKAILGLAGRSYNDRTVLGSFYDYEDYKHGLL
ncbi:uncharacterized protein SPAPADRAFT_60791 [Spathaspora passalidarum NRRL Y-27907]|uniref:RRM domain-containing protein n=1 Tax=Spathaspora passalidarum (strain NRRL Y-27907 / 11-Y1) TaxID=619300 RepID=G3AMJ0_SPAPN|nr:uncharacterized protein SPAPADRAFT_60791 [Spathaspora passalidarum NRRL Y-27907]EGW33435.1 hypothetical protein SPAPADRAFT_60791 [Spathaspora passalidarum NRRL Y-27907]